MKLLVTGASGRFATEAIKGFIDKIGPQNLILMSRKPEKLAHYKEMGCEIRYGDFEKPETLEAAAKGADRMLMISGHMVGYRIPQHRNMIEAAVRAGVKQIAYTSYFGSDADNTALVCQDHHGTEEILKNCGAAYTILRDGLYIDTVVNAMVPGAYGFGQWLHASGDGKMSVVDRNDCVECAVAVLTTSGHENKTYNITGNESFSMAEIAKLAEEFTGIPIKMNDVGKDEFYDYWASKGIPREALTEFNVGGFEWCCDDMYSFETELKKGKFDIKSNDIKAILGREPVRLKEIMAQRADEFKAAATQGLKI